MHKFLHKEIHTTPWSICATLEATLAEHLYAYSGLLLISIICEQLPGLPCMYLTCTNSRGLMSHYAMHAVILQKSNYCKILATVCVV